MIPIQEIKEKARVFGVPPSTIERDYAQNWLLSSLGSFNMALKGGTGIRKVYIEKYRFSDDLDFTLFKQYERVALIESIRDSVLKCREICGIPFQEEVDLIQTKSGFRGTVYFRIIPSGANFPIKIDLDITDPLNEQIFLPIENRKIIHLFSDELNKTIPSYSLEEIMAEKIRSLYERTRPRDLYDVYNLFSHVDKPITMEIFFQKCRFKGVEPTINQINLKKEQYKRSWKNSLHHQMKELPDFEATFSQVLHILNGFGVPE